MRQHDVRHTALASRAARVTHTRAACRRRWNKGGLPLEDGTCVLLVLGSSLETELAAGAADGRVKDAVFDEAAHSGIQARQVARRPRPLPASLLRTDAMRLLTRRSHALAGLVEGPRRWRRATRNVQRGTCNVEDDHTCLQILSKVPPLERLSLLQVCFAQRDLPAPSTPACAA